MGINQRIISAVRQLTTERGFKGWTMDELSAQAHISKRTLYRYYSSKEELIAAVIDDFLASMSSKADELIASGSAPQQIIRTLLAHLLDQGKFIISARSLEDLRLIYPHLWDKIDAFRTEKIRIIIDYIIRTNSNSPVSDIDLRIFSAVVTASIQAVVNPDFILENGLTFEEVSAQLIRFLLASLNIALD
ncbi:MAG TPA: TetR/AcrR family transcriptional regulator [Syntrophomonadaceae bacterium]|nr:TetR/AcrR family transcriptional regulator [Syntrophomonadaceae bacterium]HQA06633.1 TetR/AcrR family transcriptional regulator [Syntrophomonadaceae bacterium]HQE22294.1 TetR/AcrR family transcriptional regulator [Syntrophomonadaceae bacterium]